MNANEAKHKLRELKHLEAKLRQDERTASPSLVWDSFFDLKEANPTGRAKYPLQALVRMSREQYKAVLKEYWSFVYFELFQQEDPHLHIEYDSQTLLQLDLPFDADEEAVKKRFRELAKRYHPDAGGDAAKFVELMAAYRKLIPK